MAPKSHGKIIFLLLFLFNVVQSENGLLGGTCLIIGLEPPCLTPNAICVDGTCICAPAYRIYGNECVPKGKNSTVGEKCEHTGDCIGIGEYCSSFNVCMCLSTHVDVDSRCQPSELIYIFI